MNKLSLLSDSLKENGLLLTGVRGFRYVVFFSSLSPYLEPKIPELYKEKLVSALPLGYWPRIRQPRSFSENILHRKLCTDEQLFSKLADKVEVRSYVAKRWSEEILNDVYHVTDDPNSIPFDSLPDQFVIKPTHAWNKVILVEDKSNADYSDIRRECRDFLLERHGVSTNEYWYSRIEPRIIVERYLTDERYGVPLDFKFYVFHGQVKLIQVNYDRFHEHSMRFYEPPWTSTNIQKGDVPVGPDIDAPTQLDTMTRIAETLGDDFEFIRVDLYQPNGESVVFGELTLAPAGGRKGFQPTSYDFKLGSFW